MDSYRKAAAAYANGHIKVNQFIYLKQGEGIEGMNREKGSGVKMEKYTSIASALTIISVV
jgi:hypothetical protein